MKKFKTFLLSIILISVLTLSIVLCACKNADDIPTLAYSQYYSYNLNPHITDYFDDESKLTLTAKINSVKELKSFCEERRLQVYNEEDKPYKYDGLSKKLREYDDKFFKKHSIVLIFLFEETTDYYRYDSVNIKNNSMTVNFVSANGNANAYPRTQARIFEINKKLARKIEKINVQKKLGELDQKVNIKIYEDSSLDLIHDKYSTLVNSVEDMNVLCGENTSPIFIKNKYNKNIIEKLENYDKEFFENKSLVVLFRFRSSGMHFYYVKDFDITNEVLNITLARNIPKDGGMYTDDVIYCVYFLEFDKEKMQGVTQIKVNEIEIKQ